MTGRARVVVTHWVHPGVHDYLAGFSEVIAPSAEQRVFTRAETLRHARTADALVTCMADSVDEEFLAACPRLRIVSATLRGFDNFDVAACTRHGVWLTTLPEMLIAPTAELALGLTIGLLRRIAEGDRHVRAGHYRGWRPTFYGTGIAGSRIGIVGMGRLGAAVAERLAPFAPAAVAYSDPAVTRDDLEHLALPELLVTCAVVIVTAPLTAATRHLLDHRALALTGPDTFLVNIGRGSVVDEDAVADALDDGRLAGYAADVFAMEDWALPGHPDAIPDRLLRNPRTLFTPHLGSAVDAVRREMSFAAAAEVERVLDGERPHHPVNEPPR